MSALDLAKLSRHLITRLSANYYHYFSEKEFVWHNIPQPNRDLVLGSLAGCGRPEDRPYRCGGLWHHHLGEAGR